MELSADAVTADGEGRVYVCDYNNDVIHVLSERDGSYLGVIDIEAAGIQARNPIKIAWHQESESLVVLHEKIDDEFTEFLSVLARIN